MAHRSIARSFPPLKLQLLNVPVMDNTADVSSNRSYAAYQHTPALPAAKMLWFRNHYLPSPIDGYQPQASPLLYSDDAPTWHQQPHAIVVVGELDVLREEGEQYAAKLKKHGSTVELHVMRRQPHPFLAMDGVLQAGRQAITFMNMLGLLWAEFRLPYLAWNSSPVASSKSLGLDNYYIPVINRKPVPLHKKRLSFEVLS
ncbi:hypothetical protein LOZ48_003070 [Ophidiomyces ophidiicola]|nr:hypothetical protein LOZ48_003070 [Ophidiomyces ophidiicola]